MTAGLPRPFGARGRAAARGRAVARDGVVVALLATVTSRRPPTAVRLAGAGVWAALVARTYRGYRRDGQSRSGWERERLAELTVAAYARHYGEDVPTTGAELASWSPYHRSRHLRRYDAVAAHARAHLPAGGRLLDLGSGAALVADRLREVDATYVGLDYGAHHTGEGAARHRPGAPAAGGVLRRVFVRGDGAALPLADGSVDVVVMTEVIEHLVRPELAVWELARVLRPGGWLVLTTNNACQVPPHPPLAHLGGWLEKAVGASWPPLVSGRPWVWPESVAARLVPPDVPEQWVPHTWHVPAETVAMLRAAGLATRRWWTFEPLPADGLTAAWLDRAGAAGRLGADVVERVAGRTPGVRRLGSHLALVAEKVGSPAAPTPPSWVWPGPFSR